jgi:sigma-54 dependent transcriptional regulator, acetoin dehydrogenase operon transcriptional activator AcoR
MARCHVTVDTVVQSSLLEKSTTISLGGAVNTASSHAATVLQIVRGVGLDTAASVNPNIVGSWRRCALDYSLDPGRHYAPTIIDAPALSARCEEHAQLLQIASAEIDWLYEYIAESGYALILSDATGVVLYEKSDTTLASTFRGAGLLTGANWSERCEGTNGIGTCIAESSPVVVRRDEHYRSSHIGLTCFGSPIRDPAGSLVAVLDASTLNALGSGAALGHTMALVDMSARLIEKCLFLRHFEQGIVFRFHARPEFVNLQHDGAIALAQDATIIAVDETTIRLLGGRNRSELIGRRIDEIFDVHADEVIEPSRDARSSLQSVRDVQLGRRFFASLDHGARAASLSRLPSTATRSVRVMRFAPASAPKSSRTLEELAGEDPQMLRNVRSAHRIASLRVPVMIQGPTGAGKEVFARALHAASDRAAMAFVALNCAAIPESLIESELFGYRSGAFTGARREGMKGKILQSSGGTLFLDEIGDMPVLLQTRLLRVLEEQEVVPLGTEAPVKVDLRVICASHQDLRAMIAKGLFREDLYYRLNGITLELPPLAARMDKERLIREFLSSETSDGRPAAIEMEAFQRLLTYGWPGNVRELRNVIRTALAICDGGVVRLSDLPSEVRSGEVRSGEVRSGDVRNTEVKTCESDSTGLTTTEACGSAAQELARPAAQSADRQTILRAIELCGGNMSHAAQRLGVSRNTLYRRCKLLDIPLSSGKRVHGS